MLRVCLWLRFGEAKVVVMTVPKDWRDTRATNQLHIDHKHIESMREVRMPFSDYAQLLLRPPSPPARAAAASASPGEAGWDWGAQHVYVRHKMPSDHKGDTLGPQMQRLLARDFPNSTLAGVARIATDGQLAVHDTKMRSGTAGLYYPAHSDCYHNVLLVLEGVRRVRLLDQPAVWRGAAGSFSDLLRLTELEEAAVSRIRAALSSNASGEGPGMPVLEARLEPGEALYIPPMWLHDVLYEQPGMGINQFYSAQARPPKAGRQAPPLNGVQAEVQLCKYLKARLDQGYAEGASAADAGATEAELRGEVAQMLAEAETLKQRHRRRQRPGTAADRKREPSGEL